MVEKGNIPHPLLRHLRLRRKHANRLARQDRTCEQVFANCCTCVPLFSLHWFVVVGSCLSPLGIDITGRGCAGSGGCEKEGRKGNRQASRGGDGHGRRWQGQGHHANGSANKEKGRRRNGETSGNTWSSLLLSFCFDVSPTKCVQFGLS